MHLKKNFKKGGAMGKVLKFMIPDGNLFKKTRFLQK